MLAVSVCHVCVVMDSYFREGLVEISTEVITVDQEETTM